MQILINCSRISIDNYMRAYLENVFNKKPILTHNKHPFLDNELQMSVYISDIEVCLKQMADRVKELCSIWDFNQSKASEAIFNDTMEYMQSIAMWTWGLKMIHEKYPNKENIELFFTSAIRVGGNYFTRQHVDNARQEARNVFKFHPMVIQ